MKTPKKMENISKIEIEKSYNNNEKNITKNFDQSITKLAKLYNISSSKKRNLNKV